MQSLFSGDFCWKENWWRTGEVKSDGVRARLIKHINMVCVPYGSELYIMAIFLLKTKLPGSSCSLGEKSATLS